jgi:hypothetical protein
MVCMEATSCYFGECPVCAEPIATRLEDVERDEVIAQQWHSNGTATA